jgi:tRNA U34 5-methylaminomethyl-2-thiouridine-forming methyltransferase MnmC
MKKEFIVTEDGSHTIYLPEINEHYHSVHGAIQESLHIYIGQGLLHMDNKELSILEIGFGTGLNAWLTYCIARQKNLKIHYFSLEKYPLKESEFLKLNYTENIFQENTEVFKQMHSSEWNRPVKISPDFVLEKVNVDLITYNFSKAHQFDLVYFDAFAPDKQPEMWTDQILQKVAETVCKNGILVTYCAKGSVRRSFSSAGFNMERIPGPPGKKEILRGKKAI